MKDKLPVLGLIFAFGLVFSGYSRLQPSADLKRYKKHFVVQKKLERGADKNLHVTFFGVSTLLIDDGETQLLIDGFFTRPGVVSAAFGKIYSDSNIVKKQLQEHSINRLIAVFVAHSHYDHALDAPEVAKRTDAIMFGSSSTINIGKGVNLPDSLMRLFEAEKEIRIGKFSVTVVPSKHSPPFKILGKSNATNPEHPDITEPLKQPAKAEDFIEGGSYDFYIKHEKGNVFIKSSANYIDGALRKYPTDVFFLGVGRLGTQSEDFKESYFRETVEATGAKTIIPVHWDNFTQPLDKPLQPSPFLGDRIGDAFDFLIQKCEQQQRRFCLLQGGERILISDK